MNHLTRRTPAMVVVAKLVLCAFVIAALGLGISIMAHPTKDPMATAPRTAGDAGANAQFLRDRDRSGIVFPH